MYLGLESIKGDHPSKFAQDLINLFQKLIDARDKETKVSKRIKAVEKLMPMLKKELEKIIFKHTGMQTAGIELSKYIDGACGCVPLIGYKSDALWDQAENADMIYGVTSGEPWGSFTTNQMKDIKNTVKDFIQNGKVNSKAKMRIRYMLFYDPYLALLSRETLNKHAAVNNAHECAADILHEIGHCVMLAEKAADTYIKVTIIRSNIKDWYASKDIPISDKIEVTKHLLKENPDADKNGLIQNTINNLPIDYEENIMVKALANIFAFFIGFMNSLMLADIGNIIVLTIVYSLFLPFELLRVVIGSTLPIKSEDFGYSEVYDKIGDLPPNKLNQYYTEYYADNYGLKHGLAMSSASSLNNLGYNYTLLGGTGGVPMTSASNIQANAGITYAIMSSLIMAPLLAMDEHGSNRQRFEAMMRKIISQIKKSNLPERMKTVYLEQYQAIAEEIPKRCFSERWRETVTKGVEILTTAAGMLSKPIMHYNQKAIDALVLSTEKLINNNLYVGAAQIESLLKKLKK